MSRALHPPGGEFATGLRGSPGHQIAAKAIQSAAGFLCPNQGHIQGRRRSQGGADGLFRDLRIDHALNVFEFQSIHQMPRYRFSFTIRVCRQDHHIGIFGESGQLRQHFLAPNQPAA